MKRTTKLTIGIFIALFGMVSVLSLVREISNTLSYNGAVDFNMFWYYGHFVRQGMDPYKAFLTNQEPTLPVDYLDERIPSNIPLVHPDPGQIPNYPPIFVILMGFFSFISWPTAKILWMICNFIFTLTIPWLTIRLWSDQPDSRIDRNKLLLASFFWALLATRNVIGNGQTSLVVLVLMLTTLLMSEKNWVLAGLALGLALSKFSLSIPILMFLLFKRDYRVVAVGIAAQIIGIIALSLISGSSTFQLIYEYILIAARSIASTGVNLASIFPRVLNFPVSLIFTLLIFGFTGYWVKNYYHRLSASEKIVCDRHILTILVLWALLAVYHNEYDAVVYIIFVSLILNGLRRNEWRLSEQQKLWLGLVFGFFLLWMVRPGSVSLLFLPVHLAELWVQASQAAATLFLFLSLGLTIALLYRLSPPSAQPA